MKIINKTKNMDYVYNKSKPYSILFNKLRRKDYQYRDIYRLSPYNLMLLTRLQLRENMNNDQSLNDTLRKEMGYQIENMLVSCYFNFIPCYSSDFVYFYDYRNGNCFTFNSGKGKSNRILHVSTSDSEYAGLVLELFVGNPDVETYYEFNDGFLLSIHNQSSKPFIDSELKVPAGAETDLKINRNFISKLKPPHGDCQDESVDTEIANYMKELGLNKYSQNLCMQVCQQQETIKLCNCSNPLWPKFDKKSHICSSLSNKSLNCALIFTGIESKLFESCFKKCPIECKSIKYEISTSSALYPNKFYAETILSKYLNEKGLNLSNSNIYKSFAKINLNYEAMQYKITEHKISIKLEDLLSNFGGTLSLFLGISFISFIEILNLCFNLSSLILECIKKKIQN
jgi:hypothetical protein